MDIFWNHTLQNINFSSKEDGADRSVTYSVKSADRCHYSDSEDESCFLLLFFLVFLFSLCLCLLLLLLFECSFLHKKIILSKGEIIF